ncbi:hypothetical protein TUBRATIS_19000 [Tubulinosema ratisbonensis]|uniref:Transmembrane protein n=1 Tax=Tubulinosema ratisbonensis TaxID=291195 RepID=A0A437AKH8_9MICR|nr:hypothetical protein TUBRATIS_19000 [Tubulinosema ratisbonensis]
MQINPTNLLKKYSFYSLINILFISAITNMLSKNLLEPFNKPFYHIYQIKNTEYLYYFFTFTIILYLQYKKYTHFIPKKYFFILSFISKMIFCFCFEIKILFWFDIKLIYQRNFVLLTIINIYASLIDTFYLNRNIKCYKPEGFLVLIFKKSFIFFKNSFKEVLIPLFLSFLTYNPLRSFYLTYILKKDVSFFNNLLLFLSFMISYFILVIYYFFTKLTIFSYEYNISNIGNFFLNNVNFNELQVHSLFFNKLICCFEEKEGKNKILRTKSMINYLKKCLIFQINKINESLQKLEKVFEKNELTKYSFIPYESKSQEFPTKGLFKKIPKKDFFKIILQELKTSFFKRYYWLILQVKINDLKEMIFFMKEAEKEDFLFKFIVDLNYQIRKEIELVKEKCLNLEKKYNFSFWDDKNFH